MSDAVKALSNDKAADAAMATLSGAAILAGRTGGTAAVAAAATSAVLLMADVQRNLMAIDAKQDQDAARKERAVVLIDVATALSNGWLEILAKS
jgi:hypothetical protein